LNFNNNKTTYNKFFGVWELAFVAFGGLKKKNLTPSTLKSHNFLNSILFFIFFSALDAPIRGVQVLFGHQK
jgi:hypothetical protein